MPERSVKQKIAVFGGGQLGRMLGSEGVPLDFDVRFMDPLPDACAQRTGPLIVSAYDSSEGLDRLLANRDVATYEFENVPLSVFDEAEKRGVSVYPPRRALEIAQDRLREKQFARELGFQTASFAAIDHAGEAEAASSVTGFPAILKTRRNGYDGKGQIRVENLQELQEAAFAMGTDLILESVVPFVREWSIVSVRGKDERGREDIRHYPLIENRHKDRILRVSRANRAPQRPQAEKIAQLIAERMLRELDYVGVFTVELFELADGTILVNEIAPRVHNSAHWTINASATSQFANHLRAICGWPLGPTGANGYVAMINLIGSWVNPPMLISGLGDAWFHFYGKEARKGRKVGHITVCSQTYEGLEAAADKLVRYCKAHKLGSIESPGSLESA